MSSDRQLPPDMPDEIDDADVSRAWAATKSSQPPSRLDDAVLKFARDAQAPVRARRRWQAPLALAAVLTLGLGVVLQLWREPQVRAPQVQNAPAPVAAAAPMPEPPAMSAADAMRDAQAAAAEMHEREATSKRSEASVSKKREAAAAAEMQRSAERERREETAASAPPPPPPAAVTEDLPAPAPSAEASFGAAPQAKALASAPPVTAMRAYAPMSRPAPVRPALAMTWQPANFHGLLLGTTTREQVQQRYGDSASAQQQRATEFEYDAQSHLSRVSEQLAPPLPATAWVAQQNWPEPPQRHAADWQCEGSSAPRADSAGDAIWVYPTRGAWLVLDAEQRVLQVNYAASCR